MKKPIYKRWWFIVLMIPVTLFVLFIILGLSGVLDEKEPSPTTTTTTKASTGETADVSLKNSVSTFENLTDAYEKIPNTDGKRSTAWEEIKDTEVVWSGKVIDSTNHTLVIVRTDKWEKGMDWNNVQKNPKDPYYVFIADFNNDIDSSAYPSGTEVTIKGSLDSRGDPDMPSNWKLYNCEIQ